jgi:signal transduction histidine kinase
VSEYLHDLQRAASSARAQIAFGGFLFLVMVALLFMSSRTGKVEIDEGKQMLGNIEAINFRLDGAMSWSMFEFQMDFDFVTQSQKELLDAVTEFREKFPEQGSAISELFERKLTVMEDFKTTQSVLRNSRTIATQLIEDAWNEPGFSDAADLFTIERAFLTFMSKRDPASAAELEAITADIGARDTALAASAEWESISAHLLTLTRYVVQMGELMGEMFVIPLPTTIIATGLEFDRQLHDAAVSADQYRAALFAMGLVLLLFSGLMTARVRRYFRMVQRTNDELESRVADRTKKLAEVNNALRNEISERESVESQLQIARKLESIGQLAAGIAHEINTPAQYVSDNVAFLENVWRDLGALIDDYELSFIAGDVDCERSRRIWDGAEIAFLRDEVPAAFTEAAGGLEQISKIVLAMKTFSHPGSDGLQPADLNKALESVVTIARNEWKYVAELSLDLDPGLPAVPSNVSALSQVVLNLVVNAAQAIAEARKTNELGRIKVSSKIRGEFAEIAVEDDGPGVPQELRDRIFDPFFTTKEVGKGTGQGLAIAHRIIHQQHGGTLRVESADGKGARFIVRLPIRVASPSELPNYQSPKLLTA